MIKQFLLRLLFTIQFPLFVIYSFIPIFWLLEIPYWIILGRSLWEDWWKLNGFK